MSVISLVERLTPVIESELNLVIKSEEEAASLSEKLEKIQEGLQEAEREGVTNKSVKRWLKQLEDVTYEMDDVLDGWESTKLQVEVQDTSLNWDKVCSSSLLASLYSCFNQVRSRREATLKMKALSVRIDNILTDKGKYTFVSGVNYRALEFKQGESTSLVNKKKIKFHGLDRVKDSLVHKLVPEGEGKGKVSDDDAQIISIVGVGGVGKSTLARVAFNDPEVDGHFSLKGWVSVSQTLDSLAFAKAILERFVNKSDDALSLETVVQRIKEVVDNKRFLLVLDNVWEEDTSKWEEIKDCLDGGKGSRIVVTTRDENVAKMMGTAQWQPLGLLSDLDCGIILNGIALERRTGEECEKLRDIGMDIAKKCNGLPLAANSVGSMLALRSSEREWRAVLESPLWKDKEKPSNLFRLLNLSYTDLSPVLKRCLLSSVIFPKGSSFGIDEISRVWMACGYLNSNGVVDVVQLQGFQYLDELTMRSFFQRVADEDGDGVSYKMHDIMYDFATHLLGSDEYSFIRESGLAKELPWNSLGRFRTFCVSGEELRPDMVSHLTNVRVLSVRGCNLQALPKKVGKLVHLRYLNVSGNPITKLPEAITDLCNLQTLDVGRCKNLSSLPQGIGKLIKLRHLVNSETSKLVEFPQGLEKLTDLQTLNEFRGSNLGCLRNLNQLQGSLSLFLENLDEGEFGDPYLWKKQHITKLELELGPAEEKDEIVEALKPPSNLLTLEVTSRSGKWLSHWIHTSFANLKVVSFFGESKCSDVPPFCKLPALEQLQISFCSFERLSVRFLGLEDANSSISAHVAGSFPRLKKLTFFGCFEWQEWEDIEEESVPIMPLLEELEIEACSRLDSLPHWVLGKATSLKRVMLSGRKLYERYNKISGYDRDKIPNQGWTVEEGNMYDLTMGLFKQLTDDWTTRLNDYFGNMLYFYNLTN